MSKRLLYHFSLDLDHRLTLVRQNNHESIRLVNGRLRQLDRCNRQVEMVLRYDRVRCPQDDSLNDIAQFAHVAWPIITHQGITRIRGKPFNAAGRIK